MRGNTTGTIRCYMRWIIPALLQGALRRKLLWGKCRTKFAPIYAGGGGPAPEALLPEIVQEQPSGLQICDADSDILLEGEQQPLSEEEYRELKCGRRRIF